MTKKYYHTSLTLLAYLLLIHTNCQLINQKQTFNQDGISFQIPNNWTISTQDTIGNEGKYISCEKKGTNETSFLALTWMYGEFDPNRNITIQQDEIRQNPLFLQWRTQISPIQQTSFAQYKALKSTYTTRVKDQEIRGDIYCFNCGNKAITIILQGTASDLISDAQAWQLIRQSFQCNSQ